MVELKVVSDQPLLPVRMLNEFSYCPRLFFLEHVHREWRDSADTLDGKRVHRRVDHPSKGGLSGPEHEDPQHVRSVLLGDEGLGLVARIDLVETDGAIATPVDYKRGRRPDLPEGAYEPERVQLCAQGLLLRRHGFRSDEGVLYFVSSRERVTVPFSDLLIERTLELAEQARAAMLDDRAPPPLVDSPKCPRCSLVGICLPDEQNVLLGRGDASPRRLNPPRDDALPLHVEDPGSVVGKDGQELIVRREGREAHRVRLIDVSRVNLHGGTTITLPAIREVTKRQIPVGLFSFGGWYYGRIQGHDHKNVFLRLAQFAAATDEDRALAIAQRLVRAKIRNCRVLLRRNHRALDTKILDDLKAHAERTARAKSIEVLLGTEGNAARIYFSVFSGLLKNDVGDAFRFETRNRRPPRDPVNALLSFAYSLLVNEWTATLATIGFDPYVGYLHQPLYGRPALSLDLMEEFRPIVADSVVVNAINTGVVGAHDFEVAATAVALKSPARKRFIACFERRMEELVTHPVFGYRISYRKVLDVQARLFGRYLLGEVDRYPEFVTR